MAFRTRMPVAFITHPECLLHDMGSHHPECPDRLTAVEDQLIASGIAQFLSRYDAPLVTREQLERVHLADYLDAVEQVAPQRGIVHLDPDTAMNPHTLEAAGRAAGAVVLATDLVAGGTVKSAFCSIRPPGHHATRTRAMGFCLYNNVAVGLAHALEVHGIERAAVVDFDVHHGNGTEDIFSDDPKVLMVGTFQHPFYPYSGAGDVAPNMINVPLAAGSDGKVFRAAVEREWLPALEDFAPEMIFFSAGFDAHREDEMASLQFREDDYAWVTRALRGVAERHAQGRMVSVLEGGYALSALGRSVVAHLRALGDF
jgi:acetoin utilization deacetylase AcuC-like enzyme